MSSSRTRGFEFSPRTPRKRALRDTEGVYEISLRAIRPQIVRNTLGTFYLWGCTPDPVPKCRRHIQNNQKYCGINVVNLSESNFRNPFGVRRAPNEPASAASVVKNPASKSHFTNHNKTAALSYFLSLFSNRDSSFYLFALASVSLTFSVSSFISLHFSCSISPLARGMRRDYLSVLPIVSSSRHKTNVFVQFKETIKFPVIPLYYNVPLARRKMPFK